MPNDCWSFMTITCEDPDQLTRLVQKELQYKENGALVYHETIEMVKRGVKGIVFRVLTAASPNFVWLESLLSNYPSCWVKNEWEEEGGHAGVWVGYTNEDGDPIVKQMTWNDLCIEAKYFYFLEEPEEQVYSL